MYDLTLAYEELNSLEKRITYLEEQTAVGKEVTVELVETIILCQSTPASIGGW